MSVAHKEKLIDLVKLNPGLWRQSRKARGFKQKLWDEVGAAMGTSGFDAKRQWEILRDQLRRETRRYKENPNYKSAWTFYSRMQFALPPNDGSTSTYLNSEDGGERYYPDSDCRMQNNDSSFYFTPKIEEVGIQVRKDLQESNDSLNVPSLLEYCPSSPPSQPVVVAASVVAASTASIGNNHPSTSTASGVSSSTQKRRRLNRLDEDAEIPQNYNNRYPSCEVDDEDYYFAMSLVPSLRCIPRSKKLRIRSRILDFIASALEGEFDEESNYGMSLLREDDIEQDIKSEPKIIPEDMLHTSMQQESE